MKFMTFVKSKENAGPPPMELMGAIAAIGEEAAAAGVLVETGGLAPVAAGARIQVRGGEVTVVENGASDATEPVGGWAIYDVASQEEAIKWCTRFMDLHKQHWGGWEGETEIRQIFGPEDFAQAF